MEFVIEFPSDIKILPIDPVFSNWVNSIKKVSNISEIQGALRPSIFFFEI